MRIEFDPTNPDEAAAVRAMLTAMHPYASGGIVTSTETRLVGEVPSEQTIPVAARIDPSVGHTIHVQDGTTEVDSEGIPWDARIHSTPPTTNKDGTWRAKRGVKAEEIATVKAEREAAQAPAYPTPSEDAPYYGAEPAPAQEIPTAEDPDDPKHVVADPIVTTPPAPPAPTGQSVNPEPVASIPNVAAPTANAGSSVPSFLAVMKAITAAQKDGKIDTAKVKELCAAVGAGESTMGLNGPDNGDKRGAFMALLATETEGK